MDTKIPCWQWIWRLLRVCTYVIRRLYIVWVICHGSRVSKRVKENLSKLIGQFRLLIKIQILHPRFVSNPNLLMLHICPRHISNLLYPGRINGSLFGGDIQLTLKQRDHELYRQLAIKNRHVLNYQYRDRLCDGRFITIHNWFSLELENTKIITVVTKIGWVYIKG